MKVLMVFSTIEGQTGKIARFLEKMLGEDGHETSLIDAEGADEAKFDGVDAVILAAPVHERRHPRNFEAFVTANNEELATQRTMLLSVSLSAAFPEGMGEAQDYATEMCMRTSFTPNDTLLVAGAVRTDAYDYYSKHVLQHVVLRNRDFDPSGIERHEFTDWDVLAAKVRGFLNGG